MEVVAVHGGTVGDTLDTVYRWRLTRLGGPGIQAARTEITVIAPEGADEAVTRLQGRAAADLVRRLVAEPCPAWRIEGTGLRGEDGSRLDAPP